MPPLKKFKVPLMVLDSTPETPKLATQHTGSSLKKPPTVSKKVSQTVGTPVQKSKNAVLPGKKSTVSSKFQADQCTSSSVESAENFRETEVSKGNASVSQAKPQKPKPVRSLTDQQYENIFAAAISCHSPTVPLSYKSPLHEKILQANLALLEDSRSEESSSGSDNGEEVPGMANTKRQTFHDGSKEVVEEIGRTAEQAARCETFLFPSRRLNFESRENDSFGVDSFSPSGENSRGSIDISTPNNLPVKRSSVYEETPHLPNKRRIAEYQRSRILQDEKEPENRRQSSEDTSRAKTRANSSQTSDSMVTAYVTDSETEISENSIVHDSQLHHSQRFSSENIAGSYISTPPQNHTSEKALSATTKPTHQTSPQETSAARSAPSKLMQPPQDGIRPVQGKKPAKNTERRNKEASEGRDKENFVKPLPKPKRKGDEVRAKPATLASKKSFPHNSSNESLQSTISVQRESSPELSVTASPSSSQLSILSSFQYSQPPPGLTKVGVLQWLQDRRMNGTWVECVQCKKWRHLKNLHDPTVIPAAWVCNMNDDEECDSCEKIERRLPLKEEAHMIYNKYAIGSLVWARIEGYPWWPAIVDDDSEYESFYWMDSDMTVTPDWYHVVFFDKPASRAWVREKSLKPYCGNERGVTEFGSQISSTVLPGLRHKLKEAKNAIAEAEKMDQIERVKTFGFLAQNFLKKKVSTSKRRTHRQKGDSATRRENGVTSTSTTY